MLEEIKRVVFSGIGAVLLTREKAEEVTRKLVEEAKLSKEEAQKVVDALVETGSRQWSDIEANISKEINRSIEDLDIASKKELHGLKSKMGKFEKRLEKLERQADQGRNG
jgi:polyhydroxyalkanoate synthesis regulator phasin